jgi:hypothetical protein
MTQRTVTSSRRRYDVARTPSSPITLKHFRPEAARPYDLDILTPDAFLVHQFHFNGELLIEKLVAQAAARKISIDALLDRLQRSAPNCVKLLR